MTSLQNLQILITRPEPHGKELCDRIQALKGIPTYLPTIEIVPKHDDKTLEQIARLDSFNLIIFVSQHAVTQSAKLIKEKWPRFPAQCRVAAVGAQTAAALRQANLPVSLFPAADWSSEGLLTLPELQLLTSQHVAIICGEKGREVLAETLRLRGAMVENIVVYRRAIPVIANLNEYRDSFKTQKPDIIVCTSGTSILHLLDMMGDETQHLLRQTILLVVSKRLVALAEQLNFKHVFLADDASHDSIINALTTIRNLVGKIYGGQ